jgi:hypothetical protein
MLICTVLGLVCVGALRADPPADQLGQFLGQHDAKVEELRKTYQEAVLKEQKALAAKLLQLAEQNPQSPAAFDALMYVAINLPEKDSKAKAIGGLAKDHVKHERLAELFPTLAEVGGDASEQLLRKALADNTHRGVQGRAAFTIGLTSLARVENTADPENAKKDIRDAETHLQLVLDKYGDVKDGDGTLADGAREGLAVLKGILNLSVGKVAPDTAATVEGKKVTLSDYRRDLVRAVPGHEAAARRPDEEVSGPEVRRGRCGRGRERRRRPAVGGALPAGGVRARREGGHPVQGAARQGPR